MQSSFRNGIGQWVFLRGSKVSCEMADVSTHEYKCVGSRSGQSTDVANRMTGSIQKVERAVSVEVMCRQWPNLCVHHDLYAFATVQMLGPDG